MQWKSSKICFRFEYMPFKQDEKCEFFSRFCFIYIFYITHGNRQTHWVCVGDTISGISTASDHDAIMVDTSLRAQHTKASPHKVHLWSKAQWPTIKEETSAFANRFCADSLDKLVDEQWIQIESHVSTKLDKQVPMKMSKMRHDQLWLTTELRRICHKKLYNKLYKWKKLKARNKPCTTNREAYNKLHHDTSHLLQKSRMRYINNILSDGLEEKSNRPFWCYIKSQRMEAFRVAPLKERGQVHLDPLK